MVHEREIRKGNYALGIVREIFEVCGKMERRKKILCTRHEQKKNGETLKKVQIFHRSRFFIRLLYQKVFLFTQSHNDKLKNKGQCVAFFFFRERPQVSDLLCWWWWWFYAEQSDAGIIFFTNSLHRTSLLIASQLPKDVNANEATANTYVTKVL